MKKKKISAFTLTEVIISMLIASLLVILAWNTYFFLIRYQRKVEGKASSVKSLKRLEFLMRNDLNEAVDVHITVEGLKLVMIADTITYVWTDSTITRMKGEERLTTIGSGLVRSTTMYNEFNICLSMDQEMRIDAQYCFKITQPNSSENLVNRLTLENNESF